MKCEILRHGHCFVNHVWSVVEPTHIEEALAECKGRFSGTCGAAVKFGLPLSTLDSKIRALKIDKRRFYSN